MSEEHVGPQEADDADDLDFLDDEDEQGEPEIAEDADAESTPRQQPEPAERPAERQPSRANRRITTLRSEIASLKAERDQFMQAALQRQQAPPPQIDPYQQAELRRQEQERIQLMPPDQMAQYFANQAEQRVRQQMQQEAFNTRDMIDRQNFENRKISDPAARRLASQVENYLGAARAQGMNPTRMAVYQLLIGQEYLERADAARTRDRRNGQRAIARQTTQPGSARSTAANPRQRGEVDMSEAAIEERLRNVVIGS